MSARQLLALLGIVALLVLAIVLKQWRAPKALTREEAQSLEVQVPVDAVDRITLRKGAESPVELQKAGGAWQIPSLWGIKGDAERVRKFLESVAGIKGEARGQSEELFGDFGITDAEAIHIILAAGGQDVVHLLIGTTTAGPGQLFIRKTEARTVFLCNDSLLAPLGLSGNVAAAALKPDPWADFRIFSFAPELVQTVELRVRGSEWHELGGALPFERDANQLLPYLQGMLGVRADGVVDPAGTGYGFDDPEWELRLNVKDGAPLMVTVGALKADSATQRYLRVSDDPHTYHVAPSVLERIKADGSRFIASNPLAVVKDALQTLMVHTPEREVSLAPAGSSWKGLEEYLASLETFHVSRVDTVPARAAGAPPEPNWLTVQFEGREPVTIACEAPAGDASSDIRCVHRGNQIPFMIARPTFQLLFENVGRLERPADAAAPANAPATSH